MYSTFSQETFSSLLNKGDSYKASIHTRDSLWYASVATNFITALCPSLIEHHRLAESKTPSTVDWSARGGRRNRQRAFPFRKSIEHHFRKAEKLLVSSNHCFMKGMFNILNSYVCLLLALGWASTWRWSRSYGRAVCILSPISIPITNDIYWTSIALHRRKG